MLIVGAVASVGALVGALAYAAVRRWPNAEVPRVPGRAVRSGVRRHPRIGELLTRRLDASQLTGLALTVAVVTIVVGVTGLGLLFVMVQTDTGLARWDLSFARFGASNASDVSTRVLRDLSLAGSTTGVLGLTAIVAAIEYRRTREVAVIGFLALVAIGQFALSNLIKLTVGRPRPDLLSLTGFSGSSFPSGHATAAAATLLACAFVLARHRPARVRATLVAGACGIAAMVAATRVLLGVHWFTDVLAGVLVGWAWFAVCSIFFGGRVLHFAAPAEQAEAALQGGGGRARGR